MSVLSSPLVMSLNERRDVEKFLNKSPKIEFVRFSWIDYSGVLRTRFVPAAQCLEIVDESEDYLIPQVSMIVPVSTAPECFPSTMEVEVLGLRPDCSSLRVCGFKPNQASVMCFVEQKNGPESEQYALCPRDLLSTLIERYERDWGKNGGPLAGFELEFMLLDENSQPLNDLDRLNSYQTTAGLRGQTLDIVEEIIDCLKQSSIKIYHFHTETRDQIEIALSPEPLLNAIDSLVLAQETIRTVFVRHNIRATMTPKPLLEGPTNGLHLHMSLNQLELPQTDSFLAGVMKSVRSLCALGMASFDSYARTVPNAAGEWAAWGTENRDLPVRRITEHHWEFRMMDSTANPYLFAAAILLAGYAGIRFHMELDLNDCVVIPHMIGEQGNDRFGLIERMPKSLHEALESLKVDDNLHWAEYEKLILSYVKVKEKEVEMFEQMTEEQRRQRFLEYF